MDRMGGRSPARTDRALTRRLRFGCGLTAATAHTVRTFRLLAGGVRADGRALNDRAGVNGQHVAVDRRRETIHAARRGATAFLADSVVLRTVTGAFEPLRGWTVRHAAAEMRALLVQRHDARFHRNELS